MNEELVRASQIKQLNTFVKTGLRRDKKWRETENDLGGPVDKDTEEETGDLTKARASA